jgi:hypothetical protein
MASTAAMVIPMEQNEGDKPVVEKGKKAEHGNRNQLCTLAGAWNPDDHIEELFTRIRDAQHLATKANEPITDGAAIRLTITALKNTGVFESALELWSLKPEADKTMDNFK